MNADRKKFTHLGLCAIAAIHLSEGKEPENKKGAPCDAPFALDGRSEQLELFCGRLRPAGEILSEAKELATRRGREQSFVYCSRPGQ